MRVSMRWEWPCSLTGRVQFPTRARAWDQASKSRETSRSRNCPSSRGVSGGRSRGASSRCPGNASGARAGRVDVTAVRVWSCTGLTTPRWVCHAASAVPAARHTRFGRSAVQLGEQGSRRGDRRSAETRQTKDFADGVTSVRVFAAASLCTASGQGGEPTPGECAPSFCVKLSAAQEHDTSYRQRGRGNSEPASICGQPPQPHDQASGTGARRGRPRNALICRCECG